jgi:hypothetical protein
MSLAIAVQFGLQVPNVSGRTPGAIRPGAARGDAEQVDVLPATAAVTRDVSVVVLKYFPLTQDGQNIDIAITGDVGDPLATVQAKVNSMTVNVASGLSLGSAYREYANPSAPHDLSYTIVDTKEFHEAVPAIPSSLNPAYPMRADYVAIMSSIDVCAYVLGGVDQIWIWAYQGPHQLDISESKMSGPYGDISNSYRLNEMPDCGRTYTVYTFNYGRGTGEAIHSQAHQLEAELAAVDPVLFTDLYEGTVQYPAGTATGRCGSVHNPPNSRFEYDWTNATSNPTDCLAWDPDGLGPTTLMSCSTWGCADHSDTDNPQRNWIVFWMQNFPGIGNAVSYHGRQMRDWWDVHFDFDAAMGTCRTLVLPCQVIAPTAHIASLPTFGTSTAIPLSWTATAGTGVITGYDVRYRRARWSGSFGGYTTWRSGTASTSGTFSASSGYTYCFAVRVRDSMSSVSSWTTESCTAIPLDDRSLARSGSWTAGTGTRYFKGTFVRSSAVSAKLTRTGVVAKRLAILATTCATCGSVRVYWGSTLLKTISLHSSTTVNRKLLTVATFSRARSGTLTIKVYSSGRRVLIDGLVVRRN